MPVKVGLTSGANGDNSVVNPVPLTVLLAESVVKAPVPGDEPPIAVNCPVDGDPVPMGVLTMELNWAEPVVSITAAPVTVPVSTALAIVGVAARTTAPVPVEVVPPVPPFATARGVCNVKTL